MSFALQNVYYSFTGSEDVLREVSLELEPGKFYGVLGPNGSGKTTFLDLLQGHKTAASGKVLYKDKEINSYGKKELAREIALVPQDFVLHFPFRVREIILMGRYPHLSRFEMPGTKDMQIVERAMEQTGTAKLQDSLITELSGGEKQRVVFARALAQTPAVLLLDEATSQLDIKYGLELLKLTAQLNQEQENTIIAVFHDINQAARFCDELLFFKQGELDSSGPIEQIFSSDTLNRIFRVRAKIFFEPFLDSWQAVFQT